MNSGKYWFNTECALRYVSRGDLIHLTKAIESVEKGPYRNADLREALSSGLKIAFVEHCVSTMKTGPSEDVKKYGREIENAILGIEAGREVELHGHKIPFDPTFNKKYDELTIN